MASFTLPTETWLSIATYLDRHDCLSLVLVSRNFHRTFIQALYSDLIINIKSSPGLTRRSHKYQATVPSKFDLAGPSASLLLERLGSHSTLRNSVRSVHIMNLTKENYWDWGSESEVDSIDSIYDTYVGAVMGLLRRLPLLQRVELTHLEVHSKWLIYLAGHLTRQLDIHLKYASLYGSIEPVPRASGVPDSAPTLIPSLTNKVIARSLVLKSMVRWEDCTSWLTHFLSSPSITTLDLGPLPPSTLYDAFSLLGQECFPSLRSVTIANMTRTQLRIFHAFPALRELKFFDRASLWSVAPIDIPRGDGPQGVLSKLEVISVNNNLIPALTAGRNITTIITEDAEGGGDMPFRHMGERFGSEVMIRTLEWWHCSRAYQLLDFLIKKNPGLWHLTLDSLHGPTSEDEFLLYVPKIVRLKELRTFNWTTLSHAPSERTLAWEREHCESLRKWGCSSLVTVSFNTLIYWTRHANEEVLWKPHGPGLETYKLKSNQKETE